MKYTLNCLENCSSQRLIWYYDKNQLYTENQHVFSLNKSDGQRFSLYTVRLIIKSIKISQAWKTRKNRDLILLINNVID